MIDYPAQEWTFGIHGAKADCTIEFATRKVWWAVVLLYFGHLFHLDRLREFARLRLVQVRIVSPPKCATKWKFARDLWP